MKNDKLPRALFVTQVGFYPPYGGERLRCYNLVECLSGMCEVTVLSPLLLDSCPALAQVQAWRHLPTSPANFNTRLIESRHLIWPKTLHLNAFRLALDQVKPQFVWFSYGHWGNFTHLPRRLGIPTVMDAHNIQSKLSWQGLWSRPFKRKNLYFLFYFFFEKLHEELFFHTFDRITSVSENDRSYHARFVGAGHSKLLPNFVNEVYYQSNSPGSRDENLIVMCGSFFAFQNLAGADWFIREVWPIVLSKKPNTRLLLVGRSGSGWRQEMEKSPGVRCTGEIPSPAPFLRQAALAIVPLLHGSGSRFKILEALACETPLVSTARGAEGLKLAHNQQVLLADDAQGFASAIVTLLGDAARRQRLADNGLELLRSEYNLTATVSRLKSLLGEMGVGSEQGSP